MSPASRSCFPNGAPERLPPSRNRSQQEFLWYGLRPFEEEK